MDFEEKDTELIELLAKIRTTDSEYPEELLAFRRQQYIKELGAMGVFVGSDLALEHSSGSSLMPPVASKVVEMVLVIAIVAEAGVVAFLNRDKLTQILHNVSKDPRVEQVSTSLSPVSMPAELELTNTVYWDSTPSPSVTVTITSSLAPSPTRDQMAEATSTEGSMVGATSTGVSVTSTLQVVVTPGPKSNNGNHYGQTPKPERTKENGNNPKDPKKTKEPKETQEPKDPKPTKKPKGK